MNTRARHPLIWRGAVGRTRLTSIALVLLASAAVSSFALTANDNAETAAPSDGNTAKLDDSAEKETKRRKKREKKRSTKRGKKTETKKKTSEEAGPRLGGKPKGKIRRRSHGEKSSKSIPLARAQLPRDGTYAASSILELAGKLTGRPVQPEAQSVLDRKIEITPLVSESKVTIDEIKVLLAAHRIYLFEHGDVLIATSNPRWKPRKPRYIEIVEVEAEYFRRVYDEIQVKVDNYNAMRPKGEIKTTIVAAEDIGKIFVRSGNRRFLAEILVCSAEESKPDPNRPRLFAYSGRYRLVSQLRDAVLKRLSAGERARCRFVIRSRGNQLLYRAPQSVADKIQELLAQLDRRS